jgi:hypothetical protein
MHVLDIMVINHPNILNIKNIIDNNKYNKSDISAIYGSYLPIIYTNILNSIGFSYNAFSKYDKPLCEVDCDTMSIKILDDYIDNHGLEIEEFICKKPITIAYHTEDKPVQNTSIKTSSLHILTKNCWDNNYTSAILIYEKDKNPYIIRHPDFTEFLFGTQPIQLICGKSIHNLYNYDHTIQRLLKAQKKWY